ncbi:carboxypeptidase regulatory-like domain-containing protein [Myroides sp. WP-1]|uniref:carboxypeptidase regulatory-like domain-containing protein n=1 Tax=Myroides sp. WP-1 TaxID=2759944 RepID=UPI0015FDBD06|nr:carboxypeptidase regulatory-like domain-containing protein [Myroides sp. WP-1]MBB1140451.1 carboxypeptidase regulatory-like domain-containing protein [Myroides sp. WP-1]
MKHLLIKFSWFPLLFLFLSCSEDYVDENGTGSVTGKVVAAESNTPLANVKIETSPSSTTVFTDDKGNFVLETLKQGEYSVKAEAKGYTTSFKGVTVYEGKTSNVIFELTSAKNTPPAPAIPKLITPIDNEVIKSTAVVFKWSSKDKDKSKHSYSLTLKNDSNTTVETFTEIKDTLFEYSHLKLGVKYFWQVTVEDQVNSPVKSEMGSFSVYNAPKNNRFFYTKKIQDNLVIFSSDDEGNEFQLTDSKYNSFRPRKNETANKIAFFQSNGTALDIYTMDTDGSNVKKITSSVNPNGFNLNEITFSWPANSNQIYFANFDKLYAINSNGQGLQLLYQTKNGSFISEVDVNVEQQRIALKTNNAMGYQVHIFCIDFRGNHLFTVLKDKPGASSGLQLSNNGTKVLYAYDLEGTENRNYRRISSKLFIYDSVANQSTEISTEIEPGTNDLEPRFSPNEAYVIFTNTSNDERSPQHVYIKELNNLLKTRVEKFKNAAMPDWN